MRRALVLPLLVSLAAGCFGGDGNPSPAPAAPSLAGSLEPLDAPGNATAPPPLPVTLELDGCLQLHTVFPFPIAVFENLGFAKPEGFEYASTDGQTVQVLLAWWFCPVGRLNGTPNGPFGGVGSMFAAIPVQPPTSLTASDPNPVPVQLDLVPLTWVVSSQLAADHLGRIEGLREGYVDLGDVQATAEARLGVAAAQGAFAAASFGTFAVDLAYQASGGASPEGRYRMWLAPEQQAIGYLDITNGPGTTLGAGQAALRFQGDADAGAPPAWPGTSHVVDAADVAVAHVTLAPAQTQA